MARIAHACIILLLLAAACGTVPHSPDANESPADAPSASDSAPPPDAPGAIDAASDIDAGCEITPGSMQFDFTGEVQTFVVPDCVETITVDAYGAAGGDGDGTAVGGRGGARW